MTAQSYYYFHHISQFRTERDTQKEEPIQGVYCTGDATIHLISGNKHMTNS